MMNNTSLPIQQLTLNVSMLEQNIESERSRLKILAEGNASTTEPTMPHAQFAVLLQKYTAFLDDYKSQLELFHGSLRLKEDKAVSESSQSRLEIVENVEEIDYSSSTPDHSVHMSPLPMPKPMKAKKSVPITFESKPNKKMTQKKSNQKVQKKKAKKKAKKPIPMETVVIAIHEQKEKETPQQKQRAPKYMYDADKVQWQFEGKALSSTLVYMGNLPNNISIGSIQFFVMKKAKVTMRQIEETQLKRGGRSKYALVRFRSDVPLKKINAFMQQVNEENQMDVDEKKNKNQSWKKRVFVRLNNNFRRYDSEEAMYNDPEANKCLFIRNFDILDEKCHQELTETMQSFSCGELCKDIEILTDKWDDPYALVTFKHIEDAIYCRNSPIYFNGRLLEMRYARY